MAKINPFQPNYPVNPGVFVGRIPELERLEAHLLQTRAGNPTNFMITGERGIGKSSLLSYFKHVAQGYIPIEDDHVRFLVIETEIDQNTTQLGLIKKIQLGISKSLEDTEPIRAFMQKAWGFISRVEAAGVKLRPDAIIEQDETMLDEFTYSLSEIANRLCRQATSDELFTSKYDGVLILIDEADNASSALGLGSFLKLIMERLRRQDCNNVLFGLAGLSNLRDILMASHASSLRLFEENILGRLTDEEVNRVINLCLEDANIKNGVAHNITDGARALLISYSEGYPHFIQQFGFCAFAADKDNIIDESDVNAGAFGERGAMEQIGDRYYRDNFYNKVQKESYRQVLRIMAENLDGWVHKSEIKKSFKGDQTTLDNAIQALKDRYIILTKEGERGVYRLQHRAFAQWIKLYTTDPKILQQNIPK